MYISIYVKFKWPHDLLHTKTWKDSITSRSLHESIKCGNKVWTVKAGLSYQSSTSIHSFAQAPTATAFAPFELCSFARASTASTFACTIILNCSVFLKISISGIAATTSMVVFQTEAYNFLARNKGCNKWAKAMYRKQVSKNTSDTLSTVNGPTSAAAASSLATSVATSGRARWSGGEGRHLVAVTRMFWFYS